MYANSATIDEDSQEARHQRTRGALRQYVHGQKGRDLSRSSYLQDWANRSETDDDGHEIGHTPRPHQGRSSVSGMQGARTFQISSRQDPFRSNDPGGDQEGTFVASSDEALHDYDMRPRGRTRASRSPFPDPSSRRQHGLSPRNWQDNTGRQRKSFESSRSIHKNELREPEATQSSRAIRTNASRRVLVGTLDSSPQSPMPREEYNHLLALVAASRNGQRGAGSDGVRKGSSPELRESMRNFSLRAPQESPQRLRSTPTDSRNPPSPFDYSSEPFQEREGDLEKIQQATRNLQDAVRDSEMYRPAPNTGRRRVLEPFQQRINDERNPLLPSSRSDDTVHRKLLSPFQERRDDERRPPQPPEWSDEPDTERDRRFPLYPPRNPTWQGRPARFGLDDFPPSPENAHGPIPSSQGNSRSGFESPSQKWPTPSRHSTLGSSQSSGGPQQHANSSSRRQPKTPDHGRISCEGDDGFDTVIRRSAAAQPLDRPRQGSRSASFQRTPSSGFSDEPDPYQSSANMLDDPKNVTDGGPNP